MLLRWAVLRWFYVLFSVVGFPVSSCCGINRWIRYGWGTFLRLLIAPRFFLCFLFVFFFLSGCFCFVFFFVCFLLWAARCGGGGTIITRGRLIFEWSYRLHDSHVHWSRYDYFVITFTSSRHQISTR